MKIIKLFLLITVCLCATTLVHAQQAKNENNKPPVLKTEVLKQPEAKLSPRAVHNNVSSPELKPQDANEKPVAAEAPKSLVSEEEIKRQEKEKPAMKTDEANSNAVPGGEEGKKIFAGKAETPKQAPATPNTIDQNTRPLPKPAVSKEQQKQ